MRKQFLRLLGSSTVPDSSFHHPVWDARTDTLFWHDRHKEELVSVRWPDAAPVHCALTRLCGLGLTVDRTALLAAEEYALRICRLEAEQARLDGMQGFFTQRILASRPGPDGAAYTLTCEKTPTEVWGEIHRLSTEGHRKWRLPGCDPRAVGWSPDFSEMYICDYYQRTVRAFRFSAADGPDLFSARVLLDVGVLRRWSWPGIPVVPAQFAVDVNGDLWVPLYGSGEIVRVDPEQGRTEEIELPVPMLTSCCFGGDDRRMLFVSTSAKELSPANQRRFPGSGDILSMDAGVQGMIVCSYAFC